MVDQPEDLSISLYPHQLLSIKKMEKLESEKYIETKDGKINTSLGIHADLVGYGKTLSMIGLIVRNKMLWSNAEFSEEKIRTLCDKVTVKTTVKYKSLNTTIILALPPVVTQWASEFSYTSLNVAKVTKKSVALEIDPQNYDVLITNSVCFKIIQKRYRNVAWKRFVYDEPSSLIVPGMLSLRAGFTWFITATPEKISETHYSAHNHFMHELSRNFKKFSSFITIKNDDSFVRESFAMPTTIYIKHLCLSQIYNVLDGIVSKKISSLIEAGDIIGAVQQLGGKDTDNIFMTLIKNRSIELEEIKSKINIWTLRGEAEKIEEWTEKQKNVIQEIKTIETRIKKMMSELCPICYSSINEPVMESTCKNVFCGECLLKWIDQKNTCPLCRNPCELLYINEKEKQIEKLEKIEKPPRKNEVVMKILKDNPKGKFIIFSDYYQSFESIRKLLEEEKISFIEIKGESTTKMTDQINKYKKGEYQVCFMNSKTCNAGINLQETTDIILYHSMEKDVEVQIIGRANRIGRTESLTVHKLVIESR